MMRLLFFLEAYLLLLLAPLRLRFFSMQAILRGIPYPQAATPCHSPVDEPKLIEIAQRSLQLAENTIPFRISCLQRTVVLRHLLCRQQIATQLQIGVRKQGQQLEAHAWLEYQGRILNSPVAHCRQYQPLHAMVSETDGPQ